VRLVLPERLTERQEELLRALAGRSPADSGSKR
jgi:hypothetical protein